MYINNYMRLHMDLDYEPIMINDNMILQHNETFNDSLICFILIKLVMV